jgi:hypothetical protein
MSRSLSSGARPRDPLAHAGYFRAFLDSPDGQNRFDVRGFMASRARRSERKPRARKVQFRLFVQADLGRPVPSKIFLLRIIGN